MLKVVVILRKKLSRNRFGSEDKYILSRKVKKPFFDAFKEETQKLISEPQFQVIGNGEIYIEGCADILEYDDMIIKLKLSKKTLLIMGKDLSVSGYTESSITVKGEIQSLEWV